MQTEHCRQCSNHAVAVLYRLHEVVNERAFFCKICVDHALATGWIDSQALDNHHREGQAHAPTS